MTPTFVLLTVLLAGAAEPPPRVELRVGGSVSAVSLRRGWAATVDAEIVPGDAGSLILSGPGSIWTDSVTLLCRDAAGKTVAFPAKLATERAPTLTLEPGEHGLVTWYLEEEDTVKLEGPLTLQIVVDTTRAKEGWKGRVDSNEAMVTLVASPVATPDSADEKMAIATYVQALKEDEAKALIPLEAFLKTHPDAYSCLELQGDLLMAVERPKEAYAAYSRALKVFVRRNPQAEPPASLLEKRWAAEDAIGSDGH